MASPLLIEYLRRAGAVYTIKSYDIAYTALEVAEHSHTHASNLAKVVMVKVVNELAMVVMPAHYHVQLTLLADALGVSEVVLATEKEFCYRFPRCDLGAIPPFGHLYGVQTYIAPLFDEADAIAFSGGKHGELVIMSCREYMRLAYVTEVTQGVVPPSWALEKTEPHRTYIL